jgi:amidase
MDLGFSSAIETAKAIRQHEISSVELTEHILKRIDQYNPRLNAVVTLCRDEALSRARQADEALAKAETWGPLHGVPITIKDTFEIAGVRTTSGAPSLSEYVPGEDAAAVSRLRSAGAVILGHTNVPLFAGDWQTYNSVFGTTNNPWNLERTPGGSTGGGAAALGAGLTYLSLGSDLGGSIRIPAHFCGVYGHRPTFNIVPIRGHIPPPPGAPPLPPGEMATAGPLARSAADLKMALEILGGPDVDRAIAYQWSLPPARKERMSDYRIGHKADDQLCPLSSDVKEVIIQTVESLSRANVQMEEGWPQGVKPDSQYATFRYLLAASYAQLLRDDKIDKIRGMAASHGDSFDLVQARAWTDPHKHFLTASNARIAARAAWQDYFQTHDVFLMPALFLPAFPHDPGHSFYGRKLQTKEGERPYEDLMFWVSFAALAGLPATTAPVGLTEEGLPVGLQIVGPYLEDATPIDFAMKLADIVGGFQVPQGY